LPYPPTLLPHAPRTYSAVGLRALFRDSSESDALAARGFILPNNGVPAACTAVCDEPISTVNALKNCNDVTQCADVLCTVSYLSSGKWDYL